MTTYIIKTHSRHSRVIGIVFFINWCPLNLCVDSTADVLDNCCCSFCVFVQYLQCASLCRYAHWLVGGNYWFEFVCVLGQLRKLAAQAIQ